LLDITQAGASPSAAASMEVPMDEREHGPESEHPRGALLFMLIYLLTLTALWLHAYLRLWVR
jgi:hypothetical protein